MAETFTNQNHPFRNFMLSILVVSVVFFLLGKSCTREKTQMQTLVLPANDSGKKQLLKTDTVTKYVYDKHWYYLPQIQIRVDSVLVPVPAQVDTAAILQKFFTQYMYVDSTKDSNIIIVNRYVIAQNKVVYDSTHYKLLRPSVEKIITNTIEAPNKRFLSVGVQMGIGKNGFLLSPEILLTDRKHRSYGIGYDIINQMYLGKIYVPLKIR